MAEHISGGGMVTRPGAALKALRLQKGWSLAEVSRRSGLPISSLSKFENDKMDLTLDKLLRISAALDTDMAHLFTTTSAAFGGAEPSGRRSITRAGEGKLLESPIGHYRYLAYDMLNKHSIPMIIEVTARSLEEFGEFNSHVGEELLYVIEGELDLYTNMYVPVNLKKGDSIYFDSNMGHAYIAVGDKPCRALSVCVAPAAELLKLIEAKPTQKDEAPRAAAEAIPIRHPAHRRRND